MAVSDPRGPHRSCLEEPGDLILATPDEGDYAPYAEEGFTRYVSVTTPSGGHIPIFAQEGISEGQLLKARALLRFFLQEHPGSRYGEDKAAVADSMAAHGAALVMPEGAHEEGQEPRLDAQPLYAMEAPLEGSRPWLMADYDRRDASLEEIFHLVHDLGIGTWVEGALPDYQSALDREARAAIEDGRWGLPVDPGVEDWLRELEREDSLAQEYIASVIDSYYGLWGAWDEAAGGMWGIYVAKTRSEVAALDPAGRSLLEAFLGPWLDVEFRLDPSLSQDLSLQLDPSLPYTHRSQHLTQVTLTGEHSVALLGNEADNTLRGNAGDNLLRGGPGEDTVVFCGSRAAASWSWEGEALRISLPGEGEDRLEEVEWIHFSDGLVSLSELR